MTQMDFASISFARPIRKFVADLLSVDLRQLEKIKDLVHPLLGVTPRFMMQTLGTEWGRQTIDPNLWVKVCMLRIRAGIDAAGHAGSIRRWVVSDVRFDNEAQTIRDAGGFVIRITRPDCVAVEAHLSEAGVSHNLVDYTISNDSGIGDLGRSLLSLPVWRG